MPARIRTFFHDSLVVPSPVPVLGTTFDLADVHVHDLLVDAVQYLKPGPFDNRIESIHVRLTNIAGGATKCTLRLCADAAGDYTLIPDVTATLVTGITTANSGCIAVEVGIPVFQIFGGSTFYLFAKLDAGTANFAQSCITWSET